MPVLLEGGCRVSGLKEGEALTHGNLKVWRRVDRSAGAQAISLRVLEFAPGVSPGFGNRACDEVLYVLEGEGTIFLDGWPQRVAPETGIFLRPGVCFTVQNPGPAALTLVSSQCPDPGPTLSLEPPRTSPAPGAPVPTPSPFVRFSEQRTERTDDGRSFRVLVDQKVGAARVTQFIGAIPPGRAPDHFHHYEEVLCILEGRGRLWSGKDHSPLEPGSCVFLPRGQPHCVENTGERELRLIGVFSPAGSPAVRYLPE